MEEIGIDWKYFLIQLGNFVILLIILTKLLYRPVKNLLEKRSAEIEEGVENAAKIKKELESIEQKKVEELAKIKKESDEIIHKTRERAKFLEDDLARQAEEKAEKILSQAKVDIEGEKDRSLQALKDEIAGIIETSVEKILDEKVDKKKQERLIEGSIEKIKN